MVNFSKQFKGQLIPEWKDAFMDYCQLKKDLKKIHLLNPLDISIMKNESCLSTKILSTLRKKLSLWDQEHPQHNMIQVHRKLASSAIKGDTYETELLEKFEDGDAAKAFFAHLDAELNKVNQFYKVKEEEFMARGESLRKQMDILVELKEKLRRKLGKSPVEEDISISHTILCEDDEPVKENAEAEQVQESSVCGEFDRNGEELQDGSGKVKSKGDERKMRTLSGRVFNFQGKNLRMSIPLTTPTRTISALTYLIWGDLVNQSKKFGHGGGKLHISKSKLHHAEKMIKGAFLELHKGLGYLKTYRDLNMLVFVKILKKFDKLTKKQVLPIYMKVVESSYFSISDKVVKLMDEFEEVFVRYFADDDKRKAKKYLGPIQRKESHTISFFIGLFFGCFIALFVGYVFMAHLVGTYTKPSGYLYMETVYPVLSMFSLLFLHLFLYGCNIFMWRKTRINYSFIFEFAPIKELKYRDIFLICTASMSLVVGAMFMHLSLTMKGCSSTNVYAIPGLLLLLFLLFLFCPFNVLHRSSRYRFLQIIRNIIFSPLYKVVMVDFFMADQLCSQVPMLRSLGYVACYYGTGSYITQDYGYCMSTKHFRDLAYAVSFLPYYWRAMQCARRWFDEGEMGHLVNLGKYVSAMLAAGAKVAYEKEMSIGWLSLVVVLSSTATVYQLYWDFVKDWGLLQPNSKNPWLRNELMLHRKIFYFLSMGLNFILRFAWLQTVVHSNFGSVDYRVTGFFLAALEVIRRGQWNFYRLENEHLNNAGKFRAVKSVPLPFHEVDHD